MAANNVNEERRMKEMERKKKKLASITRTYKTACPEGTPIVVACDQGNLDDLKVFVACHDVDGTGCSVKELLERVGTDSNGYSQKNTLMVSAWYERPDVLSYLLAVGVDPTILNSDGKNALHFAAYSNKTSTRCVELLLSKMPLESINEKNWEGLTPLDFALHNVSPIKEGIVQLIRDYHGKANWHDGNGKFVDKGNGDLNDKEEVSSNNNNNNNNNNNHNQDQNHLSEQKQDTNDDESKEGEIDEVSENEGNTTIHDDETIEGKLDEVRKNDEDKTNGSVRNKPIFTNEDKAIIRRLLQNSSKYATKEALEHITLLYGENSEQVKDLLKLINGDKKLSNYYTAFDTTLSCVFEKAKLMDLTNIGRKELTSSETLVAFSGDWLLHGIEVVLEHIPFGKTALKAIEQGVDYVRDEKYKLMMKKVAEYETNNYEKLVKSVSRVVTDKLREDIIKPNHPDKETPICKKIGSLASKIGNEIIGATKESGPTFSHYLDNDGIADALGVIVAMVTESKNEGQDEKPTCELSAMEKRDRMVDFAIKAREKRKQNDVVVLDASVFSCSNKNDSEATDVDMPNNNNNDSISTNNVNINVVKNNINDEEELKSLKQQMKLKNEEFQKMQNQIKAIQENLPTAKEKKRLEKLLKKEEGELVLLKRPGTDTNVVNKEMVVKIGDHEKQIKLLTDMVLQLIEQCNLLSSKVLELSEGNANIGKKKIPEDPPEQQEAHEARLKDEKKKKEAGEAHKKDVNRLLYE